MIPIKIKKGFQLDIQGKPSPDVNKLKKPSHVAALPERIPFIRPRLLVKANNRVKVGTPLYEDKRDTAIKFLSPGSGEVTGINYGPRRVIQEIIIKLDENEQYEEFEKIDINDIENIERQRLVTMLMRGGLWPLIKELPFRKIADPEYDPPAIWINMEAKDPFQPAPDVYLNGNKDLFRFGIKVLARLGKKINVATSHNSLAVLGQYRDSITHTYSGNYPADDPGVLAYYTKKSVTENRSWYVNGQDVLLIASLLEKGMYPTQRTIALSEFVTGAIKHFQTRIGIPVALIAPGNSFNQSIRYIAGGVFRGYPVSQESYMGMYETSLSILPSGKEKDFFGFIRPGTNRPSYSKTFLSAFCRSELEIDSSMHGEERACVNCGTCAKICPVDILPQFTFKCVETDEIEEALQHGLLDCVECGLCSYACPSKIELCDKLKKARHEYYKENF